MLRLEDSEFILLLIIKKIIIRFLFVMLALVLMVCDIVVDVRRGFIDYILGSC